MKTTEERQSQFTSPTAAAPVLIGVDGGDGGRDALALGRELSALRGARCLVAVPGRGPIAEALLQKAVAELPAEARALPVFSRGLAAEELIRATQTGVDLLVLGSHRSGHAQRLLHNSVSSAIIQRTSCPVLVLPSGVPAPELAPV